MREVHGGLESDAEQKPLTSSARGHDKTVGCVSVFVCFLEGRGGFQKRKGGVTAALSDVTSFPESHNNRCPLQNNRRFSRRL